MDVYDAWVEGVTRAYGFLRCMGGGCVQSVSCDIHVRGVQSVWMLHVWSSTVYTRVVCEENMMV
jgi:hypothetical protein